jgi:hypothetical protein
VNATARSDHAAGGACEWTTSCTRSCGRTGSTSTQTAPRRLRARAAATLRRAPGMAHSGQRKPARVTRAAAWLHGQRPFFVPPDVPPTSELGSTTGFLARTERARKPLYAQAYRGFESLPLRFLGFVEPNSPQTHPVRRSAGRLATAAAASTNVSARRRPPPLPGFHSPAFPRVARARTPTSGRRPALRVTPATQDAGGRTSASSPRCGAPSSECRSSSEAQSTTTAAPRPRRL